MHSSDNYIPESSLKDHTSEGLIWKAGCDVPGEGSPYHSELPRAEGKRRLLLIYIHGFLGSEDSFHNFPRNVHNLLTASLAETHIVYTKIYPRYKTRGPLHIARDNISRWLSPHEASDLDVILLGHSLGGLVAAEVALMASSSTTSHIVGRNLNHRVIGLVNFDAPFLGLHPCVLRTGIGRLFSRKADTNNQGKETTQDDTLSLNDNDPNFNPTWTNDVNKPRWKGWNGALHFVAKHSHHLSRSALQYVFSYYDHAGCLNNYLGLLKRHKRLCRLEAVDESSGSSGRRVRFVNYYTTAYRTSEKLDRYDDTKTISCQDKQLPAHEVTELHEEHIPSHLSTSDQPKKGPEDSSSYSFLDRFARVDSQNPSANRCNSDPLENKNNDSDSRPLGRKFCYVPKEARRKQLWVPLYMEEMDEINAHQSMFLPLGMYYDQLVGDTAARIESWLGHV
ncbi:hypothetical protein Asppvi_011402 [Aspergillus pseudoviridinutans]|uniref:DUF676 domain-containing protein n=1 Tax=Aspergillus pseudoviridinutans TaxID=1517512 RepID=A0A9P3BJG7_9EURO|nr:uncharacterized protein Asppvi_011402 [Aspergillus pseudoviridinutans]GIJ92420.1 hypothetical protein Asppvi_011402 [Aspergillus pseudoviridinutans]